jgi:hypothetical protein
VADLPIELETALAERLARVLDVEAKIPRALEALGPLSGRDVLVLDGADGIRSGQLADLGARVSYGALGGPRGIDAADASADVVVSLWTAFRGWDGPEAVAVQRVLRRTGRLLVLLDYGRDDVSRLRGDLSEYGLLSRRDGPFLRGGYKIRVVHCFWTFGSQEETTTFLDDAFGAVGREVAAGLTRPRLSYNVAVYHRGFGEAG